MKDAATTIAVLAALAAGYVGASLTGGGARDRSLPAPPPPAVSDVEPCEAHGAPADVCVLCHPEKAPEFRERGDWCSAHGVPESQCYT